MLFLRLNRSAVLAVPVPDTHPAQLLPLPPTPLLDASSSTSSGQTHLKIFTREKPPIRHQPREKHPCSCSRVCTENVPPKSSSQHSSSLAARHPPCIWTSQGSAITKKQEDASKLRAKLSNQQSQRREGPEEPLLESRGNSRSYDGTWIRPAWV